MDLKLYEQSAEPPPPGRRWRPMHYTEILGLKSISLHLSVFSSVMGLCSQGWMQNLLSFRRTRLGGPGICAILTLTRQSQSKQVYGKYGCVSSRLSLPKNTVPEIHLIQGKVQSGAELRKARSSDRRCPSSQGTASLCDINDSQRSKSQHYYDYIVCHFLLKSLLWQSSSFWWKPFRSHRANLTMSEVILKVDMACEVILARNNVCRPSYFILGKDWQSREPLPGLCWCSRKSTGQIGWCR